MSAERLPATARDASTRREAWNRYRDTLKYATYVIFHPFDGFWDLSHENRGSLAAAHTLLGLFLVTWILRLMCTNFQFMTAQLQYINIYEQCASLLIPFLIFCVANWGLSTLFDGKGRFKDIYMAMCYALTPFILIQLPLVALSHMISFDEYAYYSVLSGISIIWSLGLAFVALMEVHDYSAGKTVVFLLATVFGVMVILFLILVFFSLLGDAVAYFVSLYREIVFRLY